VDQQVLEVEAQELEQKINNLTEAIGLGGNILSLVESLKATQARLVVIRRQLEPREAADRAQLRAASNKRVEDWRVILRATPTRAVSTHHLIGIIRCGSVRPRTWPWPMVPTRVIDAQGEPDNGRRQVVSGDRPAGLLAGMVEVQRLASPSIPSWNQVHCWLKQMEALRRASGSAAVAAAAMRV
jgi:hypothetical protein